MATNQFENSRITEGTMRPGAQHDGAVMNESSAISRDDVRDGVAEPQISNMIAEGSPTSRESALKMAEPAGTRRLYAASKLIGDHVQNLAGEELGKIEELMVDTRSGRVGYAVLSFGGFLGFGEKRFPVPWHALRIDPGKNEIVLDMDRATLERAPNFHNEDWSNMADPAFGEEVHKHYGKTPYWEHVTDAGDFTGGEHTVDRSREYETTSTYNNSESRR